MCLILSNFFNDFQMLENFVVFKKIKQKYILEDTTWIKYMTSINFIFQNSQKNLPASRSRRNLFFSSKSKQIFNIQFEELINLRWGTSPFQPILVLPSMSLKRFRRIFIARIVHRSISAPWQKARGMRQKGIRQETTRAAQLAVCHRSIDKHLAIHLHLS